jgi:hypothetical protein
MHLRTDERFVIEALAREYNGTWRPGENPPDAYLQLDGSSVPVEITTLVQLVQDANGKPLSRMSQDHGAIAMANALDSKLRDAFHGNRSVTLIITTPLTNQGRLRDDLETELRRIAALEVLPEEPSEFASKGNHVLISAHEDAWRPGRKRVAAAVVNNRATPDILANAIAALADRLDAKQTWASATRGAWLALFNRYDLLADAETYRQALISLSPEHSFTRIVLVSTGGKVDLLVP